MSITDKLIGKDVSKIPLDELRQMREELALDIKSDERLIDTRMDLLATKRETHRLLSEHIASRCDRR